MRRRRRLVSRETRGGAEARVVVLAWEPAVCARAASVHPARVSALSGGLCRAGDGGRMGAGNLHFTAGLLSRVHWSPENKVKIRHHFIVQDQP